MIKLFNELFLGYTIVNRNQFVKSIYICIIEPFWKQFQYPLFQITFLNLLIITEISKSIISIFEVKCQTFNELLKH